jgi:hypothetical protein
LLRSALSTPRLVADSVQQRLADVGLKRALATMLELVNVMDRPNQRVLHKVVGVDEIARTMW